MENWSADSAYSSSGRRPIVGVTVPSALSYCVLHDFLCGIHMLRERFEAAHFFSKQQGINICVLSTGRHPVRRHQKINLFFFFFLCLNIFLVLLNIRFFIFGLLKIFRLILVPYFSNITNISLCNQLSVVKY